MMVRFDDLGHTGLVIHSYPGVVEEDAKSPNDSFADGDQVEARCVLKGRTVSSDTAAGEAPRTSDDWVWIVKSKEFMQVASATYLEEPLPDLPEC